MFSQILAPFWPCWSRSLYPCTEIRWPEIPLPRRVWEKNRHRFRQRQERPCRLVPFPQTRDERKGFRVFRNGAVGPSRSEAVHGCSAAARIPVDSEPGGG